MTNLILDVDESIVQAARARARVENTTLEQECMRWLQEYAQPKVDMREAKAFLRELQKEVRTGGRKFTRDELNDRHLR